MRIKLYEIAKKFYFIMNNLEQLKPNEIKEKISIPVEIEKMVPYQELINLVSTLKLEDYEQFEFCGKTHQLIFSDNDVDKPIEYFQSTQLDGCDIYIWESLRKKGVDNIRRALVHELAEIPINYALGGDEQKAHEIAQLYEKKFRESLNEKEKEEFELFSKELFRIILK